MRARSQSVGVVEDPNGVTQLILVSSASAPIPKTRRVPRRYLAVLLGLAGLFGADALLFRTHLYPSILEPESAAGEFELTLWRELRAQKNFGGNAVTGVGDSRFAYYPRVANQLMTETRLVFRSAGVAGSNPQAWYYMLRDLDPTAHRYRAIMIGVDDYDDEDGAFEPDTDIRALHYAIIRLRLTDTLDFARSFHGIGLQWQAFRGALLKGLVLQPDVLHFLSHPQKRIADVHLQQGGFAEWTYSYIESDKSIAGLKIDWSTMTATYPPDADWLQRETVKNWSLHFPDPPENAGRLAAYRRTWFGRILERYRGSRTKIIFVRLPRGPIPRPTQFDRRTHGVIRDMASAQSNVLLCEEHAFESLEHPELFKDGLHLNLEGSNRFSYLLAREVRRLLDAAGK
jgi:hypothetical protein